MTQLLRDSQAPSQGYRDLNLWPSQGPMLFHGGGSISIPWRRYPVKDHILCSFSLWVTFSSIILISQVYIWAFFSKFGLRSKTSGLVNPPREIPSSSWGMSSTLYQDHILGHDCGVGNPSLWCTLQESSMRSDSWWSGYAVHFTHIAHFIQTPSTP